MYVIVMLNSSPSLERSSIKSARVEVPLHVTGFFIPYITEDPLESGSLGAGLLLTPGIKCEVSILSLNDGGTFKTYFNNSEIIIEPLNYVFKQVIRHGKAIVNISSNVPIGVGYAVSGASTLGASLALSKLLRKNLLEAAQLAHVAEVYSLTGLGDVIAIYQGNSLEIRVKPGAPGVGKVLSKSIPKDLRVVTTEVNSMHTKEMLTKMKSKIREFGFEYYNEFLNDPTIENFIECSHDFSLKVGFINRSFERIMSKIRSLIIGYTIKKGVLMILTYEDNLGRLIPNIKNWFSNYHIFKVGGRIKIWTL